MRLIDRASRRKACACVLFACWACSAQSQPNTALRPTTAAPVHKSVVEPSRTEAAAHISGQPTSAGAAVPAAASGSDAVSAVLALPGSASTSSGGPSSGTVQGAIALPDRGPGFYHNPRRPYEARFGTVELVQAIVRAAAIVERDLPGSSLTVNDLGLVSGGPIKQHASHQAGRDADILFYVLDEHGAPLPSVGVPIDPKGKGWDFKDLSVPEDDLPVQIDVPRTWHFVAALLEVARDAVQRIFIVEHVRSMLLAQAQRVRAPAEVIHRFEDITCQPGAPHDDHMHVRLFCTPEDMTAGCLDSTPVYPWREAALQALGLTPLLAANTQSKEDRAAVAKRTTTPAQARKKAGPMHAKVKKFLKEREAWIKRPRPGRPYCM